MCKSFSRGLSGDIWVTLGSRWLSSGLIVMGGLSLAACHRDVAAPHSAPKLAGQSQPALTPKADITGQWHITQVTGGAGQGVSRWTWHAGDHAGFESGLERRTV